MPISSLALAQFRLRSLALGHVAEAPYPPDTSSGDALRLRVALEDAPVSELERVEALLLRAGVHRAHPGEKGVRIDELVGHRRECSAVVALGEELVGESPHVGELLVEHDDASRVVDDENAVGGRLQRRAEQRE